MPSCQPSFPVACPGVQGHTAGIDPKTGPTSLRRGWKTPRFFGGNQKKATKSRLVKWICIYIYIYIYVYRVCQKYFCCCYYSPSSILKMIETTSQLVAKQIPFKNRILKFGSISLGFKKIFSKTPASICLEPKWGPEFRPCFGEF